MLISFELKTVTVVVIIGFVVLLDLLLLCRCLDMMTNQSVILLSPHFLQHVNLLEFIGLGSYSRVLVASVTLLYRCLL